MTILSALRRARPALLLLALSSAMGFGEAERARCEMHGLGAASAERRATGGETDAAHRSEHQHAGGTETTDTDGSCDCSCVGDCSIGRTPAPLPAVETVRVAVVAAEPRRAFDAPPALPSVPEPDRLLPFANGPPLV